MKKLLILICIIALFVNCSEDDSSKQKETTLHNFTGKELFKGILFAKGDVAEILTPIKQSYSYYEINHVDEDQKNESDNIINDLINSIENKNPNYYDSFKKNITSKNHLKIRETLINSSQLIYDTALDIYLSKTEKIDLKNLLSQIDINSYTDENGIIDKEKLKEVIMHSNSFSLNQSAKGTCWFAGIVLVAAAYVVVVHAAAAMTYVAVAWVAEAYAAIDQATAISRSKTTTPPKKDTTYKKDDEIQEEILIEEIVYFTFD
ncbi:hypothetical protein AB9T89_17920 [Flavobacterium oncorhynchi]|uniref:hypothetical protein n=1 Tax=Flavobacterium oncorhynchi TaxID=728056 RepID=UPI00351A63A3